MKARIKSLIEHRLGLRIYRKLPLGVDVFRDLPLLPAWRPDGVLFDVGANIGQTALRMAQAFPAAPIYCFEPAPHMYERMTTRTAHLPNVRRFNFALGARPGTSRLFLHRRPGFHTLRAELTDTPGFRDQPQVNVQVQTLDAFLADQRIEFVQFLKIDTEGFDLEVLKGADQALAAQRVGVVEVECGFDQDEGKFVPLETFRTHLRERGYRLFGIYEQVRGVQRCLRRCDATFVSDRFAAVEPQAI